MASAEQLAPSISSCPLHSAASRLLIGAVRPTIALISRFFRPISHIGLQSRDVVSRRGHSERPGHVGSTAHPQFMHKPKGFHPAKELFYLLSLTLADGVARRTRCPAVDRPPGHLCCNVGRNAKLPTALNKFQGVISLVGSHGLTGSMALASQHIQARIPFLCRARWRDFGIHNKPIAIFGQ